MRLYAREICALSRPRAAQGPEDVARCGAPASIWKSTSETCMLTWAIRLSGRAASRQSDGARERRLKAQVSIARSRRSFQLSCSGVAAADVDADPDPPASVSDVVCWSARYDAVWSRVIMWRVKHSSPCSSTKRAKGLYVWGTGCLARSARRAGRKEGVGPGGIFARSRFQMFAVDASQRTSAQGSGSWMSVRDRAAEWPKMDECCASMTKAKYAARCESSRST
jgi:hypothetical protein